MMFSVVNDHPRDWEDGKENIGSFRGTIADIQMGKCREVGQKKGRKKEIWKTRAGGFDHLPFKGLFPGRGRLKKAGGGGSLLFPQSQRLLI